MTTPRVRPARAATGCGSSTPTTHGGGWFPAGEEGSRIARELFPDAHVERIENGIISRPDLTAAAVRRVTSELRVKSGA